MDNKARMREIEARRAEAAKRALAEAALRREKASEQTLVKEFGGPSGPDPTRYGDWERRGIAVDF
jgi:hypothetical protein